jgi:hypothetical protein
MSSPQATFWRAAMDNEMSSLHANNTFALQPVPQGFNTIPCKWVYALKTDNAGNIIRFKARLVAKGFAQKEGIDYTEVFSPVVRRETVRVALAIAASKDYYIHQFDFQTAFLNGYVEEELYMSQPPGYHSGTNDTACRLHRSLYGLRQAPRA